MSLATASALNQIFEKLRVRIIEYVSCKGMHQHADDIAQETLATLWKRYSHLTAEGDLVPLAYQICKYKMLEDRRSQSKAGSQLNDEIQLADSRTNTQLDLEAKQMQKRLKEAIAQLGERCQTLFRLRLEGRSTAQIAKSMKVPEGTIYVWEFRCRKSLFEKLDKSCRTK